MEVFRTEKKYVLSSVVTRTLRDRLQRVLPGDTHNGVDGYMVRSLYFDSFFNMDFEDKEAGLELRKKIRLRTYDPHSEICKLEMKQKQGKNQRKRSLTISKSDAQRLIAGKYSVLLPYETDFAHELYTIMQTELYRPACIVQYQRTAFVVPTNNIRVTLDYKVEANESSAHFFDEKTYCSPVLHPEDTILEVKYNHFLLSYVKDLLAISGKAEVSASKYCMSRLANYL